MKSNPIQNFLTQLRVSFLGDALMYKYENEKPPLRSELFSLEQMEQFARTLAQTHVLATEPIPERLLKRLAENEEILLEVHGLLTEAAKKNMRMSPAGEWLLDNFYLIEEQVYTGKKHLPKGYSKGLPQLGKGPSTGLPRVYDIAIQLVSHSDGRVDLNNLSSFVSAYQKVRDLKLGELWAIPIMLRLALIENMRRLAAQIAKDRIFKNIADYWADLMTETAEKDPKSMIMVIADMARYGPPMQSAFVAELTRRLVGKGPAFAMPLTWIEERLSEKSLTSSELVLLENQKQAADQVSISNSIGSLRFLGSTDWREFVERISIVEQLLREDPVYAAMDFRTRDHYRHAIEKIAKGSSFSEEEITNAAVHLSKDDAVETGSDYRKGHVGYYLVDKGLPVLEKAVNLKLTFLEKFGRFWQKIPLFPYLAAIALITFFCTGLLFKRANEDGLTNGWWLGFLVLVSLIATSQLAISLVNWVTTLLVRPDFLPRMDLSKGIPSQYRTLVAIPSMIGNEEQLDELLEGLEVRYLANRHENLHFALVTDFPDADEEMKPGEEALLETARSRMHELNHKYGRNQDDLFFLFHRPRLWNAREKLWMGHERKRGKMGDLNALLRGKANGRFLDTVGDESVFPSIRYVITLDSDTQLPKDAAWKIIGTISHPLNHPRYNEKKRRVTEGYGILQPRLGVSLPYGRSSGYARLHGHEPGIDPYTRAISDVYQDLFREGSFIGKGIYDVDTFEKALGDRFPENRILSHDLLEGSYARCGLLNDVQLYEEYPAGYDVDMKRRHRWIRGDWQIASWLLPLVPGPGKKLLRNPISLLSRWKIFDNLRRSLVPLSLLLLISFGWIATPSPLFWTASVIVLMVLPSMVTFFWEVLRVPEDILFLHHAILTIRFTRYHFFQNMVSLVTLPFEAMLNTDAVLRTNWRLWISHRKLLEWNPSGNLVKGGHRSLVSMFFLMLVSPLIAGILLIVISAINPFNLAVSLPILCLWGLAPAVAWRISVPYRTHVPHLSEKERTFLSATARKTWAFFEKFVAEEENWLPPDNYQESPVARIAHRTSPTNLGIALLSNLSAYDFGFISPAKLIERTYRTVSSMKMLERYRGHFYNWYDTQTLSPLTPKYVSTVDSGNLVAMLLTLKQGLLTVQDQPLHSPRLFEGIRDTARVLGEKTKGEAVSRFEKEVDTVCRTKPVFLETIRQHLDKLAKMADEIVAGLPSSEEEAGWWARALADQCRNAYDDLVGLAPWLVIPKPPLRFSSFTGLQHGTESLSGLARMEEETLTELERWSGVATSDEERSWLELATKQVTESLRRARERMVILETIARDCALFSNIEYDFLYDPAQRLMAIGYNVDEHRRDNSFYDLLASESRLAIFAGIAQGKLPQDSWFALGRQLTDLGTSPVLLSWSGSMFEYLMPLLVMPTYENTLLDQTNRAAVEKQIDYGRKKGVCWGISESAYNMVDTSLNYQYRAFGVPGLGLKRGLAEDLVIAPYASLMALMVTPESACKNLVEMSEDGFEGRFGFFESIDYTSSRIPRGQTNAVVRCFMVHHQGMGLLALAYTLLDKPMQTRFCEETQFKSVLLLLQERVPRAAEYYSPTVHVSETALERTTEVPMRVIDTPNTPIPEVQLLSNGRYHVMISSAGGGYSRWKDIAVTRWREDFTKDNWGTFCYIRDLDNEASWSASFQPSLENAENYQVVFSQGRAEFRRKDHHIESHTEVVVSSEDDVEMRRVKITNRSRKKRSIEITSYAEVVLANPHADQAHPAFSNLFVETEILAQRHAILCTRRPRSVGEPTAWMFHLMKVHNAEVKEITYETDRTKFIGRTRNIHRPRAMDKNESLSGSQGPVLDPVVAIRYRIYLDSFESATVDMVYGIGDSRDVATGLIEKYQDRPLTDRAFELSWTHSQVVLRQINASDGDEQLFCRLANSIIYANGSMRADPATIIKNYRTQSGLWSYAVSGDLPIVLLQIGSASNIELVRQVIRAHAYWRLKGLMVDLVIWNEDYGGYRQTLQNEILSLISPGIITDVRDKPGGIFVRSIDQVPNEDKILFQTVARVVILDSLGSLEEQINRRSRLKNLMPYFTPSRFQQHMETSLSAPENLLFFNGTGGFSQDGTEYVIIASPGRVTPSPWVNVISNPEFGTLVSESGQAYSWIENAHESRLTPWNNDPVSDLTGETFYIRDEENGRFWSPMPLPCPGKTIYITRHGFGYSIFENLEDGIHSVTTVFVDIQANIKFILVRIKNKSDRSRRLSITGYVEWVMGDLRSKTHMFIVTELDAGSGAIVARNPYRMESPATVAFFDSDETGKTFTTDRTEFLGRNGTVRNPEVMGKARLSGKLGAGLDPCAAIQVMVELDEGEEKEMVFRLGAGKDLATASELARTFKGTLAAKEALQRVHDYWKETLGVIEIETPDRALNTITNGWLNYQTISSRIWGRTGYYQSGGAYGFRDQLQDCLSLLHNRPAVARRQILLSASRQFREGDVQHWWHPPGGRGVRTTCSDDYLWLPFVTARYISQTGDTDLLQESVNYLEGRLLNPGEESYYDLPVRSETAGTLYEHCVRAIEHGLRMGEHGLPLIGSGDWNDGMDKVGNHGLGESVWLAFFLHSVLRQFGELAKFRRDAAFADKCRTEADRLHANIDKHGWDGQWYRRAYFDDGRPLGSSENPECKIDSIPQSWSVISQGGDPERSLTGMESAYKYLVRKREGLIQLFDPPFDKSDLNPGYIKGYVPGVRENGGQYTHAAIWMIMAFSILKNRERTWELLRMINPVVHGMNPDLIKKYKVEPYVIAADVYAVPQHMGQGGWTWYTGSAGWMYQLITDYVLGIRRKGNTLQFEPCIPAEWPTVTIRYRYEQTLYLITYVQTGSEAEDGKITINGMVQTDNQVYLVNDQETHQVQIQVFMKPTQEPVLKTPQVLQLGHWEKNK